MISLDAIITNFISGNIITITVGLALIKALAKVTPWKWDEKIAEVISEAFGTLLYKGKQPNEVKD